MLTIERMWLLGASDPEMMAIESLLTECGERYTHAVDASRQRVSPRTAYAVTGRSDGGALAEVTHTVECDGPGLMAGVARIDHHRPGDAGFGRHPAHFLTASSIGQVISALARNLPVRWYRAGMRSRPGSASGYCGDLELHLTREPIWYVVDESRATRPVPHTMVMTAAADHCLGAAYRGECPGVDPDDLMRWRAASRAAFQGRSVDELLADVERARKALDSASRLVLRHTPGSHCGESPCECREGGYGYGGSTSVGSGDCYCDCAGCAAGDGAVEAADMRGVHVPELPEAGTRYGVAYVADGLPDPRDERVKVVCSGAADIVRAFLSHWAPSNGLVGCYGDPERGFAGGYLP